MKNSISKKTRKTAGARRRPVTDRFPPVESWENYSADILTPPNESVGFMERPDQTLTRYDKPERDLGSSTNGFRAMNRGIPGPSDSGDILTPVDGTPVSELPKYPRFGPTLKQIEANRRNALKSTGPRTEEGKEIVSRNAITHGLLSRKYPALPGEEEEYLRFGAIMAGSLGPEGAYEHYLIDTLVRSAWRSIRLSHIETGLLMDALAKEKPASGEQGPGPVSDAALGKAFSRTSRLIATLARYQVKLDRQFHQTMEEFRIERWARIAGWDPFYAARIKRFNPEPDAREKSDRGANSSHARRHPSSRFD